MKAVVGRMASLLKFIDIGANLTDPMYQGLYHGSKKHEPDLPDVLQRAWQSGLEKIIITGGNLEDSKTALELARSNDALYCTVGCHPTRCKDFEEFPDGPDGYMKGLEQLVQEGQGKVVALGELGLDFDRLEFCPKEVQIKYLEKQLELVESCPLPLFLHCRNSSQDLIRILSRHEGKLKGGVVHSFDGTAEDAKAFIDLGYFIGLNGCSLKTESNLEVVKTIPSERILLETDSPWCEVRATHAGFRFLEGKGEAFPSVKKEKWKAGAMIKSRNEPCSIMNVLKIVAAVKGEECSSLAEVILANTKAVFFS